MQENVSVNFGLDPNKKVEDSLSLLSSLGVKVTKVEGFNVVGDVYFTKVSSLKNVPGVNSVQVVGDVGVVQSNVLPLPPKPLVRPVTLVMPGPPEPVVLPEQEFSPSV